MTNLVDIAGRPLRQEAIKLTGGYVPLDALVREATQTVEDELRLEDAGWIALGAQSSQVISDQDRVTNLLTSRLYHAKDPLAHQAIRLWTDYTFGSGMAWSTEEDATRKVLEGFWNSRANRNLFSAKGQRRASNKLLVDGELFFAIFLGEEATIRLIDPLEITEIISNPEDAEDVRYYRRDWTTGAGKSKTSIYRDWTNPKDESAETSGGKAIKMTEDTKNVVVYHFPFDTISRRGNPLLLPALDWLKQHRRFLASRVAIMLARSKFAWHERLKGGQAAVDAQKARLHEKDISAGSTLIENMGIETKPMPQDTAAAGAYEDGRMLKLMAFAAVGLSEQYFADISAGNWATAKTVELPMIKMFSSYQTVWGGVYDDLDSIVLEHKGITDPKKQYVDRDFPPITPLDVMEAAEALVKVLSVYPEFTELQDVKQVALLILHINDTAKVLEQLPEQEAGSREAKALRGLRHLRAVLKEPNGG